MQTNGVLKHCPLVLMHEAAILVYGVGDGNVLRTSPVKNFGLWGAFKLKFLTVNLEILTFQFKRDEFPGYQHEQNSILSHSECKTHCHHTILGQRFQKWDPPGVLVRAPGLLKNRGKNLFSLKFHP